MFDIGFFELVVISVIGLLVLGPQRLPGAIRSTSRTIRNIKNMANGFKQEIEQQIRIQELHDNLKKAEAQQLKDLAPELQESVDELKAAAASVNSPYRKEGPEETQESHQKQGSYQKQESSQDGNHSQDEMPSCNKINTLKDEHALQNEQLTTCNSSEPAIPVSENPSIIR